MFTETPPSTPWGLMAEFPTAEALVRAAEKTRDAGYRRIDGYSPFPIEELTDALGHPPSRLPWLVFLGGLAGGLGGYFLQWYTSGTSYPMNAGGRPLHSWVSFIPVTFECTVLGAALTAVFAMLGMNGLPQPYHPVFNVDRFDKASQDGFFLCIRAVDPKFELEGTRSFLNSLGATAVMEVPH
jgi:hypothetical protein